MKRQKRKMGNKFLFIVLALVILYSNMVQASNEVIYKKTRPIKNVFDKELNSENKKDEKTIVYLYDPTGKTDPFKSFIAIQEEIKEKVKKPKTYLETLDLSQLELIAVILGPKGDWALVRESKGTGHVIKKGTAIGTNGGVVYEIFDGGITVREEFRDFRGETQHKDIKKKLQSLN